jgi:hypothetical protein
VIAPEAPPPTAPPDEDVGYAEPPDDDNDF